MSNFKYQISTNKQKGKQPTIRNWKFYRGFTLIELIIYMGISLILFTSLTTIFSNIIHTQLGAESFSSVQQDGRFLLARFFYDITRADSIIEPTLGNSDQTLELTIAAANYTYALDGSGNLLLTTGTESDVLNSIDTAISNLTFRQIGRVGGKNTIQVTYTVTSRINSQGGADSEDFQTTVGIR